MISIPKLTEVKTLEHYKLLLTFANGSRKVYDFSENLSHPYFQNLKDIAFFNSVKVNDGEIEWATGQDFCPHTLYEKSVDYV